MTDFTKLDKSQWDRVTTRDGRKVRILCVDGPEPYPVAGWVANCRIPYLFTPSGKLTSSGCNSPDDLILPPEPRVVFLRVYEFGEARITEDPQRVGFDWTDYRITITGDDAKIERVD